MTARSVHLKCCIESPYLLISLSSPVMTRLIINLRRSKQLNHSNFARCLLDLPLGDIRDCRGHWTWGSSWLTVAMINHSPTHKQDLHFLCPHKQEISSLLRTVMTDLHITHSYKSDKEIQHVGVVIKNSAEAVITLSVIVTWLDNCSFREGKNSGVRHLDE